MICDKNGVYGFYFASYMNMFNELRQQQVKYDVHTTSKIKHSRHFYHILFLLLSLKTDGPITREILMGHVIFASSEYGYHGYRRIARSICLCELDYTSLFTK